MNAIAAQKESLTSAVENNSMDNIEIKNTVTMISDIESSITPATDAVETTIVTPVYTKISAQKTQVSEAEPNKPLRDYVLSAMKNYFSHLGNSKPSDVYNMVLREIEPSVLQMTMNYVKGNQSKAAKVLGLSRGTLRKKLKTYSID